MSKLYSTMLLIAFVLMIIAFEGQSSEVRRLEKETERFEKIEYSEHWDLQCCPLCGSKHVDYIYGVTNIQIYCKECNLTTGYYDSYGEATEAWNSLRTLKEQ